MIFTSPLPDIVVPDLLLPELVLRHAATRAEHPALIDGIDGHRLTYAELAAGVRSFAGGLVARGHRPGDVVGIMAPNAPAYAVVFHGIAWAGGVITTINPSYTDREVHHQLNDARPRLLVTTAAFLDVARAAAAGTSVEEIVVFDEAPGVARVADLMGEPLAEPVRVPFDAPVALPYSSGTTGLSKGVVLTHRNLVANTVQVLAAASLRPDEVAMCVLPLFHIYGMSVIMNVTLAAGATVITMPRFDLVPFLQLHQEHRITRSYIAPPIAVALAKHPVVASYDLSALELVLSGAAPLSAELSNEVAARLRCEVTQGYGMTELSPVTHVNPLGQNRPGTVGVLTPNTEMRVVDVESGDDLGIETDGELWVRGPQVMAGYLNNPEATAATIDPEGWLHTGDIARVDADGYVRIVDRLKELIKYKAFQVPPAELEAVLLTHPAVADAAVVGLPDDDAGEIPVAFVVRKPDHDASAEEIMAFVAGQVAHYKQLRRLTFIDAVPKSASGKILRRLLR